MSVVRLKIDLSGTRGDEAWRGLRQFDENCGVAYGPQFGSSGACSHAPDLPHRPGEWRGAEICLANNLIAQYAVAHYLEQPRVLDADILEEPAA
jgi:hypothetical protein